MLPGRRAQAWRHQPLFRRPRHFHEEPELNVVVRGRGVLAVGSRQLDVQTGDVVLLQPGQDHALLEESPDFDLFVLALRPELASRAGVLEHRRVGKRNLSADTVASLVASLGALGASADGTAVETQLADRFAALWSSFDAPHVLCRRALDRLWLDAGASETLLASELQTDPSGISRQVRNGLGVRLVEYRARLRLMQFIKGVDEGRPLTRAALESGFGSYAQCHRVFQRALGCSPSEYFGGARDGVNALTCP